MMGRAFQSSRRYQGIPKVRIARSTMGEPSPRRGGRHPYGAGFEAMNEATMAVTGPAADAQDAVAKEIAAFPAQSLADIAAKCALSAKEGADDFELAEATVEAVAADAERLAR